MRFPFPAGSDGVRLEFVQARFTRPTVSQLLASLKGALSELCDFLDVEVVPLDGRRMIEVGVFFLVSGSGSVCLMCSGSAASQRSVLGRLHALSDVQQIWLGLFGVMSELVEP